MILFDRDIKEIRRDLARFPWDCDEELVIFGRKHAQSVLMRYLNGELSEKNVEDWADTMECRDDVGFENEQVKELIHTLANAYMHGALTHGRAKELIRMIEDDS